MAVPYTFGSATTSIPLSQLDSNFATTITLGNTAIQLGNTVTTLNNMTLANVTISSGTSNLAATAITNGTSNVTIASSGGNIAMATNGATAITIDTSQNVGIGTTSPAGKLDVENGSAKPFGTVAQLSAVFKGSVSVGEGGAIGFDYFGNRTNCPTSMGYAVESQAGSTKGSLVFGTRSVTTDTAPTERMRIDSSGSLLVGKTVTTFSTAGIAINVSGGGYSTFTRSGGGLADFNRLSDDGELIAFYQDTTKEGNISVSGTTVSYNGGHLARYAQTTTAKDESLVKGTVLSNLDAMNVYTAPTTYWTEEDELPEGVNVGDVKVETHEVANEQLNKVKVSDVEGDANVAGVFVNWSYDEQHSIDEINMAMTGDMIIRIAQGVTVARGDLLMSAGDGTAKAQGDDIVRSKTIAKVTSNHVTCTYADGSYCVPCVLMAC